MKSFIKKLIPSSIIGLYHFLLSLGGAFSYGHPSNKLVVIGVTGTNGKSTSVNLIARVLEEAGHKVGLCSTFKFKIGDKEWPNDTKITMPGRFRLQKLLSQMVKAGCDYVVVETSSEGIRQYRHKNINYDLAVFTNLSPEHIEAHGSFENYKKAKGELFKSLSKKKSIDGQEIKKVSIINLDDKNADYFYQFEAQEKIGYGLKGKSQKSRLPTPDGVANGGQAEVKSESFKIIEAADINLSPKGVDFEIGDTGFHLKLLGKFNVYNSLAATAVGISQGIDLEKIKEALQKVEGIPGRMEMIDQGQKFTVVIDYAHEPAGLENVYQTISSFPHQKIISVLGSQGGGRDRRKRPILGGLAGKYTDQVIITNEDPYDDDPEEIIDEVAVGALKVARNPVEKILDRKAAIKRALSLAQEGDIVVITGKGAEQNMVVKGGKKISWDDREAVKEILGNVK